MVQIEILKIVFIQNISELCFFITKYALQCFSFHRPNRFSQNSEPLKKNKNRSGPLTFCCTLIAFNELYLFYKSWILGGIELQASSVSVSQIPQSSKRKKYKSSLNLFNLFFFNQRIFLGQLWSVFCLKSYLELNLESSCKSHLFQKVNAQIFIYCFMQLKNIIFLNDRRPFFLNYEGLVFL